MENRTICAALLVGALASGIAWADTAPFTKQQADDGHIKFNNLCAQCHRPDLSGAMGPALTGDQFKARWGGKSIAELRSYINENMPKTAPHSLTPDKLDPIVAWIIAKNGEQPSDKPMSEETAKSATIPKK